MDELEGSGASSCKGESKKRIAELEKGPDVVVFKSEKLLWTCFVLVFCNRLLVLLIDGVMLSVTPKAMANFSKSTHSLLSILPIVIGISSGVLRLPMAKVIDKNRSNGFYLAWVLCALGLTILIFARSLAAVIAARILYGIGSGCMDFVLTVILADMTSLKNRALVYGIYMTPLVLTTLAAPLIAQSRADWGLTLVILESPWCALAVPLQLILRRAHGELWDKGNETGTTTTEERQRLRVRLRQFVIALDIPGVILAIAGISLFLLAPIHLPGTQEGWSAATFSVVLVLGAFSLTLLFVWEHYLAPVTCFPGHFMRNANLLGGCGVVMLTAASIACWSPNYDSYLQVVRDLTVTSASRVNAARIIAFAFSAPLLGLYLRSTGNYNHPAVNGGINLALMTGSLLLLQINEVGDNAFSPSIMVHSSMGIGESFLIICSQMVIMASVEHKNIAMALGIWGTFLSIGVAIGSVGATAVWTNGLRHMLENALPTDSKNLLSELLGSLEKQKQYALGTPIRDALVASYWVAQQHVLITATCLATLALACTFSWKYIDLRERNDVRGARTRRVIW